MITFAGTILADYSPDITLPNDESSNVPVDIQPSQAIEELQENDATKIEQQEPIISSEEDEPEITNNTNQTDDAIIEESPTQNNDLESAAETDQEIIINEQNDDNSVGQTFEPSSSESLEEMVEIKSEEPLSIDQEEVEVDVSVESTDETAEKSTPLTNPELSKTTIEEKKSIVRTVQITNGITTEMTQYHHWSGTYTPEFSVKVNEKTIKPGQTAEIEAPNNQIAVTYHAQFPHRRTSEETINCTVSQNTATITFDWNKKPRILIG